MLTKLVSISFTYFYIFKTFNNTLIIYLFRLKQAPPKIPPETLLKTLPKTTPKTLPDIPPKTPAKKKNPPIFKTLLNSFDLYRNSNVPKQIFSCFC